MASNSQFNKPDLEERRLELSVLRPSQLVAELMDREARLAECHRDYTKFRTAGTTELERLEVERDEARKAARAGGAVGPWMWQGDGDDDLDSMGDEMAVRITAGQLRQLLAERCDALKRELDAAVDKRENLSRQLAAALEREEAQFEREVALREDAARLLMLDRPWSLADTLRKLVEATEHLLRDHDCDVHGWEGYEHAKTAAQEWLTNHGDGASVALQSARPEQRIELGMWRVDSDHEAGVIGPWVRNLGLGECAGRMVRLVAIVPAPREQTGGGG